MFNLYKKIILLILFLAFCSSIIIINRVGASSFSGEITTSQLNRGQGNTVYAKVAWTGCPVGSTQKVDLFINAQGERAYGLQSVPGWYQAISCPTDGFSFHWNLNYPSDYPDESWGNSAILTIKVGNQKVVEKTVPIVPAASGTNTLTVEKIGTGTGRISSSGTGGFDCGAGCAKETVTRAAGSSVTINASPDTGSTFKGWSGEGCSGTHGICTFVLNKNLNVKAEFVKAGTSPLSGEVTTTKLDRNQSNIVRARIAWINCTLGSTQNVTLSINAQGNRPHSLQNVRQSISCATEGQDFHWALNAPSDYPNNSWGNSATLTIQVGNQKVVEKTVPIVPAVSGTNGGTAPGNGTTPGDPAPSGQSWSLKKGWNMVSIPMAGAGPSLADISQRCGQNTAFYRWNAAANKQDASSTMTPGHGYWVRATQNCTVPVPGTTPWAGSVSLPGAGWHMIGAPAGGINPDDIVGNCQISSVQKRDPSLGSGGQYVVVRDRLEPGLGYFIRVSGACNLVFSTSQGEAPPPAPSN